MFTNAKLRLGNSQFKNNLEDCFQFSFLQLPRRATIPVLQEGVTETIWKICPIFVITMKKQMELW